MTDPIKPPCAYGPHVRMSCGCIVHDHGDYTRSHACGRRLLCIGFTVQMLCADCSQIFPVEAETVDDADALRATPEDEWVCDACYGMSVLEEELEDEPWGA